MTTSPDPDARSAWQPAVGAFGAFGGRFASELLTDVLAELEEAWRTIVPSPEFRAEVAAALRDWAGRPTPITRADRLSSECDLEVWLKREDLLHGGAHKTNNVVGQGLLAKRLGKQRLIAETGAGQHGVATAMVGAWLGLETVIYMGAVDVERQAPNVRLMKLCGATVIAVDKGAQTLKEAINEAMRDWTANASSTHYLLGTVCGPHPFPSLVRDLQRVIGDEAKAQMTERGIAPDALVACVGGGSNAIGLFTPFLDDDVKIFGVEPGGSGITSGRHGAALVAGSPGLLHGARTYLLQSDDGQVGDAESMAAGLDYPGVGPEHAFLKDSGRVQYVAINDDAALAAFENLARIEGIVPAFETAHALAFVECAVEQGQLERGSRVLLNLSGRGQKDLETYFARFSGGAS